MGYAISGLAITVATICLYAASLSRRAARARSRLERAR